MKVSNYTEHNRFLREREVFFIINEAIWYQKCKAATISCSV